MALLSLPVYDLIHETDISLYDLLVESWAVFCVAGRYKTAMWPDTILLTGLAGYCSRLVNSRWTGRAGKKREKEN